MFVQMLADSALLCCLQYGESVPVADWFGSFRAVFEAHACGDGTADAAENPAPPKRSRGRPPKADPTQVQRHVTSPASPPGQTEHAKTVAHTPQDELL